MSFKELLYITTIAKEGSISAAAKKLYITQPALSHCLINAEEKLGVMLFKRNSTGLSLTYAGERYCDTAERIMRMYDDLKQELSGISELKAGRVDIGMTRFLAAELLPNILPQYHIKYPNIEFGLLEDTSSSLIKQLSERKIDLAVVNLLKNEINHLDSIYECNILYCDELVIVASNKSELLEKAKHITKNTYEIDPAQLADVPFIMVNRGQTIRKATDRVLDKANISPKAVLTTSSFETAKRMACSGIGVTMIPKRYATLITDDAAGLYFEIPKKYSAYIVTASIYLRADGCSVAAKRFSEEIEHYFQAPEAPPI